MSSSYFKLRILKKKKLMNKKQNIYKQPIPENTCRICLKEGSIPFHTESSFDILNTVRLFTGIEIREGDDYPQNLCNGCISLLRGAVLFRKTAIETDKILRDSIYQITNTLQFADENILYDNYINETIGTYCCKRCKLYFSSLEEYEVHKSSKQHKSVRIQCSICNGLLTPQLYKRHLARHQSASHLICDVCGKLYRKDSLLRHLQLHNHNLPFQCQVCPYRGRFLESLKSHMRTHSGYKPFSCEKCELCFLTRSNLNRHLLTHLKERPHKCIECGRGFYTNRELDAHFKDLHSEIKEYNCKMCGNKYGTRKAMMRHELRVHKRLKIAQGRIPLYLQEEYKKQS